MAWRHKKTLDQRFQDTYTFIQTQMAGVGGIDLSIELMNNELAALDASGAKARLLEVMSLGFRWEIRNSADETRRRHYIRAVLMGYVALGDPDQSGRLLTV